MVSDPENQNAASTRAAEKRKILARACAPGTANRTAPRMLLRGTVRVAVRLDSDSVSDLNNVVVAGAAA